MQGERQYRLPRPRCQGAGSEFKLRKDISPEQQQTARAKLEAELAEKTEKERAEQDLIKKEATIQAEQSAEPVVEEVQPPPPQQPYSPLPIYMQSC